MSATPATDRCYHCGAEAETDDDGSCSRCAGIAGNPDTSNS